MRPLLFFIAMDIRTCKREVPWDMLYAYDLSVANKEETGIQTPRGASLNVLRALESKGPIGLTLIRQKPCSALKRSRQVGQDWKLIKQTEIFKIN